ncbi:hypothetical protein [Piscinibacter sp. XHJ-5]|uniref:hypothetical protein n=1 Tax=Piscinibacter sp. XHJ-5 TaxID=3037797 RepID=UPI00245289E7|nr:hypothetical protein [Piscinibacter sp. XHJ-5]
MTDRRVIVIATPHARYDGLERQLRAVPRLEVVRLRQKSELSAQALSAIAPQYVFLPHWSWIIPAEVHERFECVVFHMTDLPFGRGGSPLQNLIVRGIETTQLSALRCTRELDAGPIYLKKPLSLNGAAEEIFLRAARLMKDMILEIVEQSIRPVDQQGEPVIFRRRRPEDGDLSGLARLEQVHDHIRMLDADGYPPAFLQVGDLRLEFRRSRLSHDGVDADVRITLSPRKETP